MIVTIMMRFEDPPPCPLAEWVDVLNRHSIRLIYLFPSHITFLRYLSGIYITHVYYYREANAPLLATSTS